jgi:hypothetical protein
VFQHVLRKSLFGALLLQLRSYKAHLLLSTDG